MGTLALFKHTHSNRTSQFSSHGILVDEGIEIFNLKLKPVSSFKVNMFLTAGMKQSLAQDMLSLMKSVPVSLGTAGMH